LIEFEKIFSLLNKKKVHYLVTGGIAVNLYGISRATADIDLIVDLETANIKRFISAAKELGLKPKLPLKLEDLMIEEKRLEWKQKRNMVVFSLFDPKSPFFLLDVFVDIPFDFDTVYNKREKIKAGNVVIPVIPITYLIRMKEKTGRPQDRSDVYHLKKIRKGM
jgi:hypothetical protein